MLQAVLVRRRRRRRLVRWPGNSRLTRTSTKRATKPFRSRTKTMACWYFRWIGRVNLIREFTQFSSAFFRSQLQLHCAPASPWSLTPFIASPPHDRSSSSTSLITSLSSGHISYLTPDSTGALIVHDSWTAHDHEPWITAWDKWAGRGGSVVWSGGDDLKLKRWDVRESNEGGSSMVVGKW